MYNLTNVTDANNLFDFTVQVNSLVNGAYAVLILLVLFFIILIGMRNYDFFLTLLVASAITLFIGAFFLFLQMISWGVLGVIFVILVGALIVTIWRG